MALRLSQLPVVTAPILQDVVLINHLGVSSQTSLSAVQAAIQGAGFQLNGAAPNNVISVVQALATGLAGSTGYSNIDIALVPKGTGAFELAVPDNTATGGNKRGASAVDLQMSRTLNTQVAVGPNSVICGGGNNSVTINAASYSVIGGGFNNQCTNQYATVAGGNGNVAGNYLGATVSGGQTNSATGLNSTIPGGLQATTRAITGMLAYASGAFSVQGDAQLGEYPSRVQTSNASTLALCTDGGGGASINNTPTLSNNSAYLVYAEVVARDTATGNAACFECKGLVKRGASAATTAVVGASTSVQLFADAGAAAWTAVIVADTGSGCAKVNVTGAAATTIHWMSRIRTVEVT